MDEILMCSVCCEPYMEKLRHPVVLPRCGHSFCRPCVAFLVKNGCVICPSCRMDQRVETADNLPTEFSLLAVTNAQKVTKMEICDNHGVKLSFWCKTCSYPACGECLFEDHPTHSHTVVKATKYVTDTKDAVMDIANKFTDALDFRETWYFQQMFNCVKNINDSIRTLSVLRRDMEDARELIKGAKMVEGIGATTALSDASKCLGLKWNLKDCQLLFSGRKETAKEEKKTAKEKEKTAKEEKEEDESEVKKREEEEMKEKCNGEIEKEVNEKEKEGDEENLTEEEKKKRRKILRVREKLAAAAAACENEKKENNKEREVKKRELEKGEIKERNGEKNKTENGENKDKNGENKDKNGDKIKNDTIKNDKNSVPTLAELKTRNLAKKYQPVAREPSMSPERPKRKASMSTQATQTEVDKLDKLDNREKGEINGRENENGKEEEKGENSEAKMNGEVEVNGDVTEMKDIETQAGPEATPKDSPLSKSKSGTSIRKRGPGRLARQALKRSQTMNFSPQNNQDSQTDDPQSQNIRGLDLETSRKGEDAVDNKEIEAQVIAEVKEEEEKKEEEEEKKKEEEKKDEKGAVCFEMEPEEKERITTELLEVPNLTVVVEGIGGRQAYVTWEKEGLHIYCHQYQDLPYDIIVKSTVLHSFIPTKSPVVFLDVGSEHKLLGRVYIKLWGRLRRATNFLHLCLGDRGPSYRNTMFLEVLNADCPGERIKGGDYEFNNGRGGETLIDDLEFQEGYSMPMVSGMLTAGGPNRKELDSQFFICTEDDPDRKFACPFGEVISGLPVMKEAIWLVVTKEMWIRDCGICLDFPKL